MKPRTTTRWALACLCLSMLMPSLDTSIANAALPTLAQAFDASFQAVQWIVLAYLLVITSMVVGAGRLGDIVGRRRLMLIGISIFTLGSILSAAAPHLWLLITARAIQGLGAAAMMSLTVALVGETVPPKQTGSAMGLLSAMSAVGTTLGPSLGGLLLAQFGWRAIFLVNLPLGLLNLFLAHRFLTTDLSEQKTKPPVFDHAGTLLLAFTLAAYALAMTLGRGHFGPLNMALLLAAVLGIAFFIKVEFKATSPLIRLTAFRDPILCSSLAMNALVSTVLMATLVVGPFYLVRTLQLSPALVGLILSIGPFTAALTGFPAGRLVDHLGTRHTTLLGLTCITAGCLALSLAPAAFGMAGYIAPIIILTAGYALFQAANNTAIMANASTDQRGATSGMLSLSRNLGLITGASVMGAVFSHASGASDMATAPADAIATGMRLTFGVAAVLIVVALIIALGLTSRSLCRNAQAAYGD